MAEETSLFVPNPEAPNEENSDAPDDDGTIVAALNGYKQEAEENRRGGPNNRDDKWAENVDLYWNRYNFAEKADWQSREVLPEVPAFVDRFAASLKEALVAVPDGFYSVDDPADVDHDISDAIKRMTDVWLNHCGRNQGGQILPFSAVFEEQAKLGAIKACCGTVTWKKDREHGRVAFETIDPSFVWLDHTYRNLYRIRRIELDKHELTRLADMKDGRGKPIFNLGEINRLVSNMVEEEKQQREDLTGHGHRVISERKPVVLDEYYATVVGPDGKVLADQALLVVANDRFLIRGPEKNPFWHGQDWLVFAPLVTTPLSVYGRSYMEDFGSIAKTFNELTNLIFDATFTSSLNAFALVPSMLLNPEQASEGVGPNKTFLLEEGVRPQDFWKELELGSLPAEAVTVWQSLKNELREAAGMNEVGLGQFAPNSRTSATEIAETQQSSNAMVRSVAQTIETRFLNPVLNLTWKTGMQHVSKNDDELRQAAGTELFDAMLKRRKEIVSRPITFRASGLSTMIRKSQMLQSLLQLLQIVGSNEMLLREFMRVADMSRLVELLFELSDIDMRKLQNTDRERMIQELIGRQQEVEENTQGQTAPAAATNMAAEAAQAMGVA